MSYSSSYPYLGRSIADLHAAFAAGATTPIDALEATMSHHAAVNPQINAIPYLDDSRARIAALESGKRWAAGKPLGMLDGVAVTVKDSVNAAGMPWRHGSKPNDHLPVAVADSPPAARLREAGAVIVGKTSMPDFGMLASGVSSLYGIVRNPWDLSATPGGSSSGAGASLAAGLTWGAIGTDIAGSVRLPAAHCGIVALKPTQGRIPHLAPSTVRSAGPMARTVADVAAVYRAVSRFDPRDTLALAPEADTSLRPFTDVEVAGMRIGLLTEMGYGFAADDATRATVHAAARAFEDAGAEIVPIDSPLAADAYDALDTLYLVRALAEFEAHTVEGRAEVLPELVTWALGARSLSATDHERALLRVAADQQSFTAAQADVDFVLSAVLPSAAFPAEQVGMNPDRPLEHCSFTAWFNQTGQPALSLPFGEDKGHPVAIQLAGPRLSDRVVLRLAGWLEEKRGATPDWPLSPRSTPGSLWVSEQ